MAPNHNSNCKQLHKTGNTRNNDNKYTRRLLRADVTAYVTALACLFSEKASAFRIGVSTMRTQKMARGKL